MVCAFVIQFQALDANVNQVILVKDVNNVTLVNQIHAETVVFVHQLAYQVASNVNVHQVSLVDSVTREIHATITVHVVTMVNVFHHHLALPLANVHQDS